MDAKILVELKNGHRKWITWRQYMRHYNVVHTIFG